MAVSRECNVLKTTTDADTISGPITICGIKLISGGASCTYSLTVDSIVVYQGNLASNSQIFEDVYLKVGQETITVGLSGTGATIYLYTE